MKSAGEFKLSLGISPTSAFILIPTFLRESRCILPARQPQKLSILSGVKQLLSVWWCLSSATECEDGTCPHELSLVSSYDSQRNILEKNP